MLTLSDIGDLQWLDHTGEATLDGDRLVLRAGPRTDWFSDPCGATRLTSAPALVREVTEDFMLSARVTPELAETYDAGVLFLHQNEDSWAKLCLERSPTGRPTIVSVVTRGLSDDCNGPSYDIEAVWLRIARLGDAYAFHHSLDGETWELTRLFTLADPESTTRVGFLAQTPLGAESTTVFDAIRYRAGTLVDVRSGI
ncbi:MAG: DUF1349 domain-containing protein [Actinomycetota bacterium]|nr:DUF1349 domain-containing protein [Actinomycetota bacterium]